MNQLTPSKGFEINNSKRGRGILLYSSATVFDEVIGFFRRSSIIREMVEV